MQGGHAGGKVAHDLLRDTVGIVSALGEGYSILETRDHVVAPIAGILIGEFIGVKAQGHPELRLVEVPALERELEAARHDSDDGVGPAVKLDGTAQHMRVAVVAG